MRRKKEKNHDGEERRGETDKEQKSGKRRIVPSVCNYCNNKLFTLCDQILLGNVTSGKDGNCCPKNNAD